MVAVAITLASVQLGSRSMIISKSKDLCGIVMPSEKDNILEFNQYMMSDKMPYIIYADIES